MKKSLNVLTFILLTSFTLVFPQDLSNLLEIDNDVPSLKKTFRAPRIVNMHSVENPPPGEMVLNIGHRFDKLNTGLYEMFGLDEATMRLGLDYGINKWLGAGIGRSTFQKTYDVYVKARIFEQEGKQNFPVSVVYYGSGSVNTLRDVYPAENDNFSDRLSLINSILFARRFGNIISFQLNPIWLHSSYLLESQGPSDDVSLGMATGIRILKRVNLNLEYIHEIVDDNVDDLNPLSLGFDIEAGGHIFQLFLSNTQGIFDKAYLINTTETLADGGVYFGFNITRVFYLK